MVTRRRRGPQDGPFSGSDDPQPTREDLARSLVGTEANPALDRLAELAAHLLGASSAQVTLVADEQEVVGSAGLDIGALYAPAPMPDLLCSVTVRLATTLVIRDARLDPRVRDLELVSTGLVGSYLGIPLVSSGHAVGALCVFDVEPRDWSETDQTTLASLVGPVLAELELAELEKTYESDRALWELAVDAAGVGVWDWDMQTGELRWDDRMMALFGHTRETFGGTIDTFLSMVYDEDRPRVDHSLSHAIATCGSYQAEYRITLANGATRWVAARGEALAGPDGTAVRVLGAAYDTTAVQDGEARVARVMEAMPSAFYHLDPDWRFTYANAEAMRILGLDDVDPIGRDFWELYPTASASTFGAAVRGAVADGEPTSFEDYYPAPLDGWFEIRVWPSPDGVSVSYFDVSDRHRAEDALARTAAHRAIVAEVTASLTETLESREAVARLAHLVAQSVGEWCLVSLVEEDSVGSGWHYTTQELGWWHQDAAQRPLVEAYAALGPANLTDIRMLTRLLASDEPVVIEAGAASLMASAMPAPEGIELCRQLAAESLVVVPMRGRGRGIGLLTVLRSSAVAPFSAEEVDVIRDIGGRAGLALDTLRVYDEQHDLAVGLQRSLLSPPPTLDHLDVAVRYEPSARAAEVGGDWYDAFELPSGSLAVVIGDVIGHDTAAAAAMGQLRSLVRGISVTTCGGPSEVMRDVDVAIETLRLETTATAVVAHLIATGDPASGSGSALLRWSNAGHPPPLLVVPDDDGIQVRVLWAERSNLLLGLDPHAARTVTEVELEPGAIVLLYTDGLVERRGEPLDTGLARLSALLHDVVTADSDLDCVCDELLRRLLPERPDDDVALVAVRLR